MRHIIYMCGYIPNKNPYFQILTIFERIIEFVNTHKSDDYTLPYYLSNITEWEREVEHIKCIYDMPSRNQAVYRLIINTLWNLTITDFDVDRIIYNKSKPYKLLYSPYSRTYKHMQDLFDKQFGFK